MVRRVSVNGVPTNKTIRYTGEASKQYRGEIWLDDATVPLSLDKKNRWETVPTTVPDNKTTSTDVKERKERNRVEKKKIFETSLSEQKQKHVVRRKVPDKYKPEVEEHETQEKDIEDNDGWRVVQHGNEKTPMWRGSKSPGNSVFVPPSKKTIVNHMSSEKEYEYEYVYFKEDGYKRRDLKKEAKEMLHV